MLRVSTLQPGFPGPQAGVAIVAVHHSKLGIRKLESFLHRPAPGNPGVRDGPRCTDSGPFHIPKMKPPPETPDGDREYFGNE